VPELSVDRVAVMAALATLPRSCRQVVVLHHLLGLPVKDVAWELRVPAGTVKVRLLRARRALATQLDTSPLEV
jgi:RNA polymerase sigma-70 factor (ECF subfamily)